MSAETELAKAKKLIQAKRYDDAKALLITIDHPTADKWLAKLNSLPAGQAAREKPAPQKQVNPVLRFVSAFIVFIAATAIAGGLASFAYDSLTAGYGNDYEAANQFVLPLFGILWLLLMFIGFRVSQRLLSA